MVTHDDNETLRVNGAVSQRLEKLRHRPVEMEQLRERVRSAVSGSRPVGQTLRWSTPLRAIAASLLMVGAVAAVLLMTSGGPVLASAAELSRIHRDNVSGASNATAVDSIQSARQVLAAQWSDCPHVPQADSMVAVSCRVHQLAGKRLACLALQVDGQPVTLVVAHAVDMQVPTAGQTVARGGVNYYLLSSGGVNIVVAQRDGLWICMMGELPVERIVDFTASLRV